MPKSPYGPAAAEGFSALYRNWRAFSALLFRLQYACSYYLQRAPSQLFHKTRTTMRIGTVSAQKPKYDRPGSSAQYVPSTGFLSTTSLHTYDNCRSRGCSLGWWFSLFSSRSHVVDEGWRSSGEQNFTRVFIVMVIGSPPAVVREQDGSTKQDITCGNLFAHGAIPISIQAACRTERLSYDSSRAAWCVADALCVTEFATIHRPS